MKISKIIFKIQFFFQIEKCFRRSSLGDVKIQLKKWKTRTSYGHFNDPTFQYRQLPNSSKMFWRLTFRYQIWQDQSFTWRFSKHFGSLKSLRPTTGLHVVHKTSKLLVVLAACLTANYLCVHYSSSATVTLQKTEGMLMLNKWNPYEAHIPGEYGISLIELYRFNCSSKFTLLQITHKYRIAHNKKIEQKTFLSETIPIY